MEKILVVTSTHDLTVDYLINKFKEIEFFRVNVDEFQDYLFLITEDLISIRAPGWSTSLDQVSAIYYRKPTLPNYDGIIDRPYQSFAYSELFSVIEGMLESYDGTCLTRPSILRRSNNKIFQCSIAKKLGFTVPKAIITNDQHAVKGEQRLVVKPLSMGEIFLQNEKIFIQTNLVNEDMDMSALKYSPSYFQQYIDKEYDVRVTAVGTHIYPVKIDSTDKVDWRKPGAELHYDVMCLPKEIEALCFDLLDHLGLRFGCIDFVVRDGVFYFLEINANGQWLWLETALGLDISEKIIGELCG